MSNKRIIFLIVIPIVILCVLVTHYTPLIAVEQAQGIIHQRTFYDPIALILAILSLASLIWQFYGPHPTS